MFTGQFRGFKVEHHEPGISLVTFTEPERLNGTTDDVKRDLTEAMLYLQMDDNCRVVVITGEGRAFCAGDDLTGRPRDYSKATKLAPDLPHSRPAPVRTYETLRNISQGLNLAIRSLSKVTIAAVNGLAVQTGFSLALSCDLRITSDEARMGSATLRFGLLPDEGGHYLLVQYLGVPKALDLMLRNRIVTAAEALDLGLVNEVVPPDQLMPRTMELATELAEGPQVAIRLLKKSVYNAGEMSLHEAFDDIASKTAVSDFHPDAREGVAAFREKRKHQFNQWLEPTD